MQISLPYSCFCSIRVQRFDYGRTISGSTSTLSVTFEVVAFKTGLSRFEDITIAHDGNGGAYVAMQAAWQAILAKRGASVMDFIRSETESAPEGMDVTALAADVLRTDAPVPTSVTNGRDIATSYVNLCTIRPCTVERIGTSTRVCFEVEAIKTRASLCIEQIVSSNGGADVSTAAWNALALTPKLAKIVAFVREETAKPPLGETLVADLFNAAVIVGQESKLSATSFAMLDDQMRRAALIERVDDTLLIKGGDAGAPLGVSLQPSDAQRTVDLGDMRFRADDTRQLEIISLPNAGPDHQGILVEPPLWVNTLKSDSRIVIDAPEIVLPNGITIGGSSGGSFGDTINVGSPSGTAGGLVVMGPPPLRRAIMWYPSETGTEGVQQAAVEDESYWRAEGGHFRMIGNGVEWGFRILEDGSMQMFTKRDGEGYQAVTTFRGLPHV
jgi:hypothetical protein